MTVVVLIGVAVYLVGVRRFDASHSRRWARRRTAAFLLGIAVLLVGVSPPLETYGHQDLRGHMAQHLLIGMYAPVGLVLGRPFTLLLATLPARTARRFTALLRSRAFHVLAHPFTTAGASAASLFVLYLTPLYAVTSQSPTLHHLVHAHFLLAGYLFTWSVAGPDPAPRRPAMSQRVTALVLAAAAHAYLGKLLYAHAGRLPPGSGHDAAAVEQAAQWMYYGGDLGEILLATALFTWWYGQRQRMMRVPAVKTCEDGDGACSGSTSSRPPASATAATSRPTARRRSWSTRRETSIGC